MTHVPHETTIVLGDGAPACVRCWRRPKRFSGGRWQSYCSICHADYMRDRRAGRCEVLVSMSERDLLEALRSGSIPWPSFD